MFIDVNGTTKEIHTTNLASALEELGWGDTRVATALNGHFIPVSERPQTTLAAGDRLEVLTAMQGG